MAGFFSYLFIRSRHIVRERILIFYLAKRESLIFFLSFPQRKQFKSMSLKVHRRGTGAISSSKLQCRSLWSHFLCLCASTARSWGQWEVLLFSIFSLCLFASFSHWPVLRTHVTVRRAVTFIQFHEPALRSALFFSSFKKKIVF